MVRLEDTITGGDESDNANFNSKMVRLEVKRLLTFQLQGTYFNSKMVRLEGAGFVLIGCH